MIRPVTLDFWPTLFADTADGLARALRLAGVRAALAEAGHVLETADIDADVAGARGAGLQTVHFARDPAIPTVPADAVLRRLADLPGRVAALG